MFGGYIDLDKPGWRWIGRIPDLVLLSLFWYICCIPVVTIVPASCALFDAVSRCMLLDEGGTYKRFFRTFWRELKKGIPLTIFWGIIIAMMVYGDIQLTAMLAQQQNLAILSIIYRVCFCLLLGYLYWVIALQSRYYNTFLQLHTNALRMFIGRFPHSALMVVITIGILILCTLHPYTWALLIFAPCVIAVFNAIFIEKGFKKAFPQDYAFDLPVVTDDEIAAEYGKAPSEENTNEPT